MTKHDAIEAYGGVHIEIHIFLTSVLAGGEWPVSRPDRLDPRNGLNDVVKRKFLTLSGHQILRLCRRGRSQSLYRLS
jgi:hypothetical protein